jgi:CrcB protein
MYKLILAISTGASTGALLRWQLGLKLNALYPQLPLGTLSANLLGGYIIGLAASYTAQHPNLSPEWRLLIMTGFCGGLTTFSTFSLEVFSLLQQGKLMWAMLNISTQVIGSLLMTFLGFATWQAIKQWG